MDKPIPEAVRAWLDEWCEDHGVELPADAYNEMLESLTAAQQQGQAVAWMRRTATYRSVDGRSEGERIVSEQQVYPDDIPLYTSPPSAPVGVIGDAIRHLSKWLDMNDCECESGHQCGRTEVEQTRDQLRALAQQPAAVDDAMVERAMRATGWLIANPETMRAALVAALATQHQEPTT